ncbi:MAG: 3-dehydroquinate synthase [Christensenella sp.]|nr:3-dehydroquinate synthase [Christensenella sp.]
MEKLTVKVDKSYDILIGQDILGSIGHRAKDLNGLGKVLVVSDDIVHSLYGEVVYNSLKDAGYNVFEFTFNHGEKSKNLNTFSQIINFLAEQGFVRSDLIIALGGGVVGDISGFVAASYMRGIDYIQVPTTLLSMIDSSVGGKTAVDLEAGKNLVGAFYQPRLVLIDTNTLLTLPCIEYKNGMGEGIKYAVLEGGELKDLVLDGVKLSDSKSITRFVYLCVDSKRKIVEEDEKESNIRRLLNLGHTFAHAIEKLSLYEIPHGLCVAAGLDIIARISNAHSKLSDIDYMTILNILEKYELNNMNPYTIDQMIDIIKLDKKVESDNINFVMPYAFGDCRIEKVQLSKIKEFVKC